jgi:hypothetical protein
MNSTEALKPLMIKIQPAFQDQANPTIWRYLSLKPSKECFRTLAGWRPSRWRAYEIEFHGKYYPQSEEFRFHQDLRHVEYSASRLQNRVVHFVSGSGSLQRGFGAGSDILYDLSTSVAYRRLTLRDDGRTGSTGLKQIKNGNLIWFIEKVETVTAQDIRSIIAGFMPGFPVSQANEDEIVVRPGGIGERCLELD